MTRRRVVPPIPEHMRVPGYFTELMRRHNWPPMFVSAEDERLTTTAPTLGTHQQREQRAERGIGWGNGTLVMPRTPRHKRPGWMAPK